MSEVWLLLIILAGLILTLILGGVCLANCCFKNDKNPFNTGFESGGQRYVRNRGSLATNRIHFGNRRRTTPTGRNVRILRDPGRIISPSICVISLDHSPSQLRPNLGEIPVLNISRSTDSSELPVYEDTTRPNDLNYLPSYTEVFPKVHQKM